MSLEQLDAFLAHASRRPEIDGRLHNRQEPLELDAFLALARGAGFDVTPADLLAAQERSEGALSDQELQRRAGEEARRLRHFIHG